MAQSCILGLAMNPDAECLSEGVIVPKRGARSASDLYLPSVFRQGSSMPNTKHQTFTDMQQAGEDFGTFYPVGHLVVAFPDRAGAQFVRKALLTGGYEEIDCRYFSDTTVQAGTTRGLETAGPMSMLGASLKMVRLHQRLARQGCHFLLIYAPHELEVTRAMNVVRRRPYRLAQVYHRLTIESLK
jgi:hypothetical protein